MVNFVLCMTHYLGIMHPISMIQWTRPMGAHADGHAFDRPDAPEQPPPPHDREFDAAVQACATAQRIAVPLADDWPPGPPPEALAQCLDDAGFAPSPHHG
ncbi:hypothetical protein M3O38_19590 [Xanthomonas nasturtii]|uniref:Xanthomonadin biosynthesis protein n=1 Tax=Xanthomonas nasturtii TaxID=1843581 RepID=A0ABT0LVS1_9XANT|nr:hypothetical protein [Xanthomonas nasturtii]MCL1557523.1 hypothetical protein [Xanthomonas nasturtii]